MNISRSLNSVLSHTKSWLWNHFWNRISYFIVNIPSRLLESIRFEISYVCDSFLEGEESLDSTVIHENEEMAVSLLSPSFMNK